MSFKRLKKISLHCLEKLTLIVIVYISVHGFNAFAGESRSKDLQFEDDLVEGMNKKPYDSFNQLSEQEKNRKNNHLYDIQSKFTHETKETLSEVRMWQ